MVVAKASFVFELRAAYSSVSCSGLEPNAVWHVNNSGSCLFTYSTISNLPSDNASNFHPASFRSCMWLCWQILCGHIGRKWIALATVLGDYVLSALLLKCFHTAVVPHTSRACHRFPRDKIQCNVSVLVPANSFLCCYALVSAIVLWSFAICQSW